MPVGIEATGTAGTDAISAPKATQDRPDIRAVAPPDGLPATPGPGERIKKKLCLDERICNNLSEETQKKLNDAGKVNVKWYTKLGLKLGAFFARGNYKTAKGALRAKLSGLAKDESFLDALAKAVSKLDGKDFNDAFKEIYKLLDGDTSNRRKFFINKLLIPCLQEVKTGAGKLKDGQQKGTFSKDTFIELNKKFSALNQFCLDHDMKCTSEEYKQGADIIKDASVKNARRKSIEESMLAFFTAGSKEGRENHLADIDILASINKLWQSSYGKESPIYDCMSMFIQDKKFGELLKCFGEGTIETQITNLKTLLKNVRSINDTVKQDYPNKFVGSYDKNFAKKFREKLVEYFFKTENDSQMWMIFKVMDANATFFASVFRAYANFPLWELDSWPNVFSYVAMEKIKSLNKNSDMQSIPGDQAKLLGQTANLLELIKRNETDDIVEILKFAQKRSLSFKDLFPPDIELSAATCVKLMAAVSKGNDGDLKNFCLEGIKQRLMPKITLANRGDRGAVNEILNDVTNLNPEAYDQLYSAIPAFGDAVKGCIKGKINKCIGAETNTSNLKELFSTLEKLEIANLSAPDTKGKFGFSLNDILGDDAANQIEQLKASIKTATNASLEKLVKTDNISAVNLVTFIEEIKTLLYLLENLGITDLSNTSEKVKFGLSLEDILGNDASQQIEKLKTSIKTATNAVLAELANVNNYASYTAAKEKIWALLDLLKNLGLANLDTSTTKGPLGFSLENIFDVEGARTLKEKMKTAIAGIASRLDKDIPRRASLLGTLQYFLRRFGIDEKSLNKQERKALGIGSTPA